MKEAIKGYITGLINSYSRLKKPGTAIEPDCIVDDLNDLLDFVEDIPEYNNKDNELLRKRIREFEDTCKTFAEVEKNQRNKIDELTMLLAAEISANEIFGGAKNE